jgi:hypothetical protein
MKKVYSIEHDKHWFNKISKLIRENALENIYIQHKPLGRGLDQEYVKGFRDISETPDFMLIDGKKGTCALWRR